MKNLFLLSSLVFLVSCDWFKTETDAEKLARCGLNPDPFDPPELSKDCLGPPPTLCPINKVHNYHHNMVIVDTTSAFPDPLANYLNAKIFEKDLWSKEIEPYTRVSLINLNDDEDPFKRQPIISICRPPSGLVNTGFSADKIDNMTTGMDTKQRNYVQYFLFPVENALSSLKKSEEAEYTILFEQIRAVTEFGGHKFRSKDYQKRSLHIVSDFMQSSKKIDFYNHCKNRNRCKDFQSLYKNKKLQPYFDSIKPLLDENTEIFLYHILIDNRPQAIQEKLKNLWKEYFVWAGVPEDQIHYNMIYDFDG